jgi:hypothetical protein
MIGVCHFQLDRRGDSAGDATFTRKLGHTQRRSRSILFDRSYARRLERQTFFSPGDLAEPHHSISTGVHKRIGDLETEVA